MQLRYLLICFLLAGAGCSPVAVHSLRPNPSSGQLDRILIMAMTTNYETRTMYEEELSYKLRDKGYNMFSSVNVDKAKKDLYTKEEIMALIAEKNIDGVITMRLKDIDSKGSYSYSGGYLNGAYNQPNYFFNYIDTYAGVNHWTYQTQQTVVVEANLFDANDKTLILQVDAVIKNADGAEDRAAEITEAFAKSLDKSGLLKKKE
ncbi:MAG: hypothetical protein HC819_19850 [Cyclobacteriaceae bacterium]|nr:hypothetical protein [Cyclobacteriaceae bacterium]